MAQKLTSSGTRSPVVLAPGMVSLDWLTVNMYAPPSPEFGLPWEKEFPTPWDCEMDRHSDNWRRYVTQPTDIRTSQFARVTYLCDHQGAKVATVWSAPHQTTQDDRWIQVQFSNETLYSGEFTGLYHMFRAIGCSYSSISRVDVACDGIEGDGGDFPQVVEQAHRGEGKYYGKCDWLVRHGRSKVIGAEFGRRASNKFIRAYRKKHEMKAKGVKEHIVRAWEQAFGFDVWNSSNNVNRFEVSLKGKEIRRYFPNERAPEFVTGLAGVGTRVDMFASMAPGMFDFRTLSERARDAEPLAVWDWSRVDASATLAPRAARNLALSDHTIKNAIRSAYHMATVLSDPAGFEMAERWAAAAGELVHTWYVRKRCQWTKEFARIEKANDPRTQTVFKALRDASDDAEF